MDKACIPSIFIKTSQFFFDESCVISAFTKFFFEKLRMIEIGLRGRWKRSSIFQSSHHSQLHLGVIVKDACPRLLYLLSLRLRSNLCLLNDFTLMDMDTFSWCLSSKSKSNEAIAGEIFWHTHNIAFSSIYSFKCSLKNIYNLYSGN